MSRFTADHRVIYVRKTGLGDVTIGATSSVAKMNGAETASHVRDRLVEMARLNETICSWGIASSYEATEHESGALINKPILANICKHNVTRLPFKILRLSPDLTGATNGDTAIPS